MSYFYELKDLQEIPLINGITMKAIYGEKSSVTFVDLPPYSHIDSHHHKREQIGIVLEGEIQYTIEGETKTCGKGAAFVIPPNAHHSLLVASEKGAKMLDIFTPKRDIAAALSYVDKK
ncbi:MAG: cupin domain-containing protein [bacterium]|nr:cupin domain-containing protein [bacterium]